MPPLADIWALFEKRPDPHHPSRSLRYKDDKTHYAAWCTGCIDRFVEVQKAAETIHLMEESITQDEVRTAEQWRDIGRFKKCKCIMHMLGLTTSMVTAKNPELAIYSGSWKGSSNILDVRGVIPVVGKTSVMMTHASLCEYADKGRLGVIQHAAALTAAAKAQAKVAAFQATQNAENVPPAASCVLTRLLHTLYG